MSIPKPEGGERELGVPTVLDRLIQQAIAQALTPVFDPQFSDGSYGYRPGRSAQQAMQQARQDVAGGLEWVVAVDLERFFDRVQHDKLLAMVARPGPAWIRSPLAAAACLTNRRMRGPLVRWCGRGVGDPPLYPMGRSAWPGRAGGRHQPHRGYPLTDHVHRIQYAPLVRA